MSLQEYLIKLTVDNNELTATEKAELISAIAVRFSKAQVA